MASKFIDIVIRARDNTSKAWKKVQGAARKAKQRLASTFGGMAKAAKMAAVAIGLIGAAAIAAGKKAVGAYQAQAAAEAKLAAVLKATGNAAGFTASALKRHAAELQKVTGVGDETIISMQGILASFKQIKGDTFKDATEVILDMGAAMGKAGKGSADVEAAVIQVGKALNDPIKGISALSRVGVTFTDQQKEQIKVMQESGNIAGAQAIILKELQSEFGGTAAAVADAQHGILQLKAAFGDTIEEIGKAIVETDEFDGIVERVTEALENLSESGTIELWAQNVRKAIDFIAPAMSKVAGFFVGVKERIQTTSAFLGALSAGSTVDEAAAIAANIGESLEKEKQARLALIREERDARKKAKEEAEEAELAITRAVEGTTEAEKDAINEIEKRTKLARNLVEAEADLIKAKKAFSVLKTGNKPDKQLIKAAKDKITAIEKQIKLLKELEAVEKRIADNAQNEALRKAQAAGKGFGDAAAAVQGEIDKLDNRRNAEREQKEEARLQRREEELMGRKMRGTKLGREAEEFLKRRDLERQLADAQENKRLADKKAQEMAARIAEMQRRALRDELVLIKNKLNVAIQAAGGF